MCHRQNLAPLNGALDLDRGTYRKSLQLPARLRMRVSIIQVSSFLYTFCAFLTTSPLSARPYFDSPRPPLPGPNTGPSRLSIAPRGLYNKPEKEPRTITNADNHFRFAQNLRQGVPLSQKPPSRPAPTQQAAPIAQLADAMLLPRQLPQLPQAHPQPEPESMNFFQPLQPRFPNPLQPQKQQITPPFNLSAFHLIPNQMNFFVLH